MLDKARAAPLPAAALHTPAQAAARALPTAALSLSRASPLNPPPPLPLLSLPIHTHTRPYTQTRAQVGVEPEIKRIGEYKSAGDQLLRADMSAAQREQLTALLDGIYDDFVATVAAARGKSPEARAPALLWPARAAASRLSLSLPPPLLPHLCHRSSSSPPPIHHRSLSTLKTLSNPSKTPPKPLPNLPPQNNQ